MLSEAESWCRQEACSVDSLLMPGETQWFLAK